MGDVRPFGQEVHVVAPAAEYVFAEHAEHEDALVPLVGLYWPAEHE